MALNIQISSGTLAQARRSIRNARYEGNGTMRWTRMLTMFTLLTVMSTALAACGDAPASITPTSVSTAEPATTNAPTALSEPSATALSPEDGLMATIAAAPTAPPRTATPTSV